MNDSNESLGCAPLPITVELLTQMQNEIYEIKAIKNEINYALNRIAEPEPSLCEDVPKNDNPTRTLDILKSQLDQLIKLRQDFNEVKNKLNFLF